VKPLARQLTADPRGDSFKAPPVFAGATIMGDGAVALILDVLGIAQRARVLSETRERALGGRSSAAAPTTQPTGRYLICVAGGGSRLAIPLGEVARLEEFPAAAVETLAGRPVIQYRGRILPLLRLAEALPERRRAPREAAEDTTGPLQVVVHSGPEGSVGLVVDQIVDVIEDTFTLQRPATRAGILGSAVVQGRVTELVDVAGLMAREGISAKDGERAA